jgi:hypothetical protein
MPQTILYISPLKHSFESKKLFLIIYPNVKTEPLPILY